MRDSEFVFIPRSGWKRKAQGKARERGPLGTLTDEAREVGNSFNGCRPLRGLHKFNLTRPGVEARAFTPGFILSFAFAGWIRAKIWVVVNGRAKISHCSRGKKSIFLVATKIHCPTRWRASFPSLLTARQCHLNSASKPLAMSASQLFSCRIASESLTELSRTRSLTFWHTQACG